MWHFIKHLFDFDFNPHGSCWQWAPWLAWPKQQAKPRLQGQPPLTENRFRLLVEAVKDYALIMLDPNGQVTSWNPGAERLTGYSQAEILGQPFSRLFPTADQAAGKPGQLLGSALAEGRSEYEGERVRKDGSSFLVHEVITPFFDSDGRLQGFTKVVRDITEQRSTQAALQDLADNLEEQVRNQVRELRESEARLQGFIHHAPANIAFKGLDGRFLLINPRMAALIGRPAEEIIGRTSDELFSPEVCARAREEDQRALGQGQELLAEWQWPGADGALHDLLVQKFPLIDATGQCWGMGIISTDITERKQADRALLQSQKLESLGVLAGGIAHDFNNLLGAMLGNVELAMAETALAQVTPYLETLKGLMDKGTVLLRQMLAYSGRGKFAVRTLDLNPLVQELTQLLATSISKKATLRLELHPQPLPLTADPAQIQQVVMNLVINASEALVDQNGDITIRTGLEYLSPGCNDLSFDGHALEPGPYVTLEVADGGMGMTEEVLKKIFDPFFTTKFTGRGLGLAAIHGILRGHQGGIQVASKPGRGSTFKLLFPAAQDPVLPAEPEAPLPPQSSSRDRDRGTVLVVDDEEAIRSIVVKALDRVGLATLQARDGLEAVALFQTHRDQIRLILMDLTMPNLDGQEACRELQRLGADVPIFLCSGFTEQDALLRFEGIGLAGFIQKPFRLGLLVDRIMKAMAD